MTPEAAELHRRFQVATAHHVEARERARGARVGAFLGTSVVLPDEVEADVRAVDVEMQAVDHDVKAAAAAGKYTADKVAQWNNTMRQWAAVRDPALASWSDRFFSGGDIVDNADKFDKQAGVVRDELAKVPGVSITAPAPTVSAPLVGASGAQETIGMLTNLVIAGVAAVVVVAAVHEFRSGSHA